LADGQPFCISMIRFFTMPARGEVTELGFEEEMAEA
jgi:hypothetical protein